MNEPHAGTQVPPGGVSDLTQYRLTMIEQTLRVMSENLERLAKLEQKHSETRDAVTRAFTTIERIDERVRHIELEMPTLKLVRKWVIAGIVGTMSLLAMTLVKLFTMNVT